MAGGSVGFLGFRALRPGLKEWEKKLLAPLGARSTALPTRGYIYFNTSPLKNCKLQSVLIYQHKFYILTHQHVSKNHYHTAFKELFFRHHGLFEKWTQARSMSRYLGWMLFQRLTFLHSIIDLLNKHFVCFTTQTALNTTDTFLR